MLQITALLLFVFSDPYVVYTHSTTQQAPKGPYQLKTYIREHEQFLTPSLRIFWVIKWSGANTNWYKFLLTIPSFFMYFFFFH